MPAPTQLPHVPAVLLLGSAAELLTAPGCPVCRYTGQVGEQYLTWFSFEGHAQTDALTRLCASLGMCFRHTRRLMHQPGAAIRLTAMYRYIMLAASDRMSGPAGPVAQCPACEREQAAADRVMQILIDELVPAHNQQMCHLCPAHLRMTSRRVSRRQAARLAGVSSRATGDAPLRAAPWQAAVASAPRGYACVACRAASRSTDDGLTLLRAVDSGPPDRRPLLCIDHAADFAEFAGSRRAPVLPIGSADWPATDAVGHLGPTTWRPAGLDRWRRSRRQSVGCPVCLPAEEAELRAVDDLRDRLQAPSWFRDHPLPLCVRHLLGLKTWDAWAARVLTPAAAGHARTLTAELDEAFGKNTWARRHEAKGLEMTAWRRAAAFLDGRVFCGSLPGR